MTGEEIALDLAHCKEADEQECSLNIAQQVGHGLSWAKKLSRPHGLARHSENLLVQALLNCF